MDDSKSARAVPAKDPASPDRDETGVNEAKNREGTTSNGFHSSPPGITRLDPMDVDEEPSNGTHASVNDGTKSDSEAETIVLPGKDGYSPSKIRKRIKHEDHSDGDETKSEGGNRSHAARGKAALDLLTQSRSVLGDKSAEPNAATTSISSLGKRKRPKNSSIKDDPAHQGNSSGLSSAPTSPAATGRASLSKPAASDSEVSKSPSPRSGPGARHQTKSVDRVISRGKNHASYSGDEEAGGRLEVRQREKSRLSTDTNSRKRTRSDSPPRGAGHRRSVSSQVSSKNTHSLSSKKKRIPAPLQSTEYHSDESSESATPHPRSSRPLRNIPAPPTGDSTISPVKLGPHKKHVNSSGQTLLARACLSGKVDGAIQRYTERPQDLNEPDHALNTPLHVASINGYTDVVKFLLEQNCTVDVTNDQKDTPLHDAIENGHVEVVRLLLDAGANPNKPNRHGDEPLDLVTEMEKGDDYDEEEANQIRLAITEAKKTNRDARRLSEDEPSMENSENRNFHEKDGPRNSPSVPAQEPHASRRGNARSIKTSDALLYQRLDVNELRKAAKEGDVNAAARVLEVHPHLNDTKSLLLATKGGHLDVVNILLGLGPNFDPDPDPDEEQATPFLTAIGRESHLSIIELFLSQDKFNPTRTFGGQTYFEIAKARAGPRWQEEEKLLKDAFERYEKSHKSSMGKLRSPKLQREADKEAKRLPRKDDHNRPHKRTISSPRAKDHETSKSSHHRSASSVTSRDGSVQAKRGPGRPRKEESTPSIVVSDPESTPLGPPKLKPQKRSESEVGLASETETATPNKPRRKLITGHEREREREEKRSRSSQGSSSTPSVSMKEKRATGESHGDRAEGRVSPSLQRPGKKATSNHHEPEPSDKISLDKERSRPTKRDDSKDRLSSIRGESPMKRPRKSETPPRSSLQEVAAGYGTGGGPLKKRKLEGDATTDTKSENPTMSSSNIRSSSVKNAPPHDAKERSGLDAKSKASHSAKKQVVAGEEGKQSTPNDTEAHSRPGKSNNHGANTGDSYPKKHKPTSTSQAEAAEKEREKENARALKKKEEEAAREAEAQREKAAVREAEAKREEELRQEEARRAEAKRKEEEEEAARLKLAAEELERERNEKAEKARLAHEEAARQEELRRQNEEAEKKRIQEIKEAEEQQLRTLYQEQERKKREDSDRIKAAAQERERIERAKMEEQKRLERLSKLPCLLQWFDCVENAQQFSHMFRWIDGYRYDSIRPEAIGQENGREQWMLNTHVALLLGEKDLSLTRYTAWERIPLWRDAKRALWKVCGPLYTLQGDSCGLLKKQMTPPKDPLHNSSEHNGPLFFDMDLFFVKVSEFMFIVPSFPHLRNLEMLVSYRELDTTFKHPPPTPRFMEDPDYDQNDSKQKFIPQPKIYKNGLFFKQRDVPMAKLSYQPPSDDKRVPRRELVPVAPHEPDYEKLCRKQGIIPKASHQNGITPPGSDRTKSVNGGSPLSGSALDHQHNGVIDHSASPIAEKASGSTELPNMLS
ncbi:hypothetical protein HYFRA_00007500 [Hymenoscyphus fraxineus]|uniref:Ankyrin n=1 Tax=Hymenoscyphus fraxineus TaxID=746836 RepID=A0A9N9KPM8_9HELO|nr:hypothetical protein HYFRA_00007500 [Hymenoscyphus fraxineus]